MKPSVTPYAFLNIENIWVTSVQERAWNWGSPSSVQDVQDASLPTRHSPLKKSLLSARPCWEPAELLINSLWSWTCHSTEEWAELFFSRLLSRQWGHCLGVSRSGQEEPTPEHPPGPQVWEHGFAPRGPAAGISVVLWLLPDSGT